MCPKWYAPLSEFIATPDIIYDYIQVPMLLFIHASYKCFYFKWFCMVYTDCNTFSTGFGNELGSIVNRFWSSGSLSTYTAACAINRRTCCTQLHRDTAASTARGSGHEGYFSFEGLVFHCDPLLKSERSLLTFFVALKSKISLVIHIFCHIVIVANL
jgi:hypothetical protein